MPWRTLAFSLLEIEDEFGSRVANLVGSVSKRQKDAEGRPLSRERTDEIVVKTMEGAAPELAALGSIRS
jgi:hypothetical protein